MELNRFMDKLPKQQTASPETVKDFSDGRIPEGHRNTTMSRTAALANKFIEKIEIFPEEQ